VSKLDEYEINDGTLALITQDEETTTVYEDDRIFSVAKNANEIMEDSCAYFGSSLAGRQQGTNNLIGVTHKSPIIVEESREIIFFPTCSPRLEKCSWVSLKNIEKYYTDGKKVVIEFKNGRKLRLNLSYGVIDNQILRATRLESVLRGRKSTKKL